MTQRQYLHDFIAVLLVAALLMSLAISHLHDLASFKSEIELAREAYSQSISEMREIRSRLDEIEQRQFDILRIIAPSG